MAWQVTNTIYTSAAHDGMTSAIWNQHHAALAVCNNSGMCYHESQVVTSQLHETTFAHGRSFIIVVEAVKYGRLAIPPGSGNVNQPDKHSTCGSSLWYN